MLFYERILPMPTIIKNTHSLLVETKRKAHGSVPWHVRTNVWCPPTDMYETETSFVVKVEIAGANDEDIEVILQEDLLLISGVRSDSSEHRAYHQMEIPFGKFSVNITLPVSVNIDGAMAEYRNGFLTIELPKE